MAAELFTQKFVPKTPQEFIGNSEILAECIKWGEQWEKGIKQKPLLLYGDTGTGKTSLAIMLSEYFGWQLFELNASHFRTKDIIEKIVGAASQNASFDMKKRLVLLDEIDGIHGKEDKGGLQAILQIIKDSQNPLILTANDIYADKKLAALRTACTLLQFKKINYLSISAYLKKICEKEGIEFEDEALKELARNCNGDMRSALLDLQSMSFSEKILLDGVKKLSLRERQEDIFKTMNSIFHAKTFEEIHSARMKTEIDPQMLFLWVEENLPRQLQNPEDCAEAFNWLSKADIFNERIFKRQNYDFLRYSLELSTTAVGLSKTHSSHSWIKFEFPKLLSKLSVEKGNRALKKSIALKIGKKTHSSAKTVLSQDWPFMLPLMQDKEKIAGFAATFDFSIEEIAFLINSSPDTKKVKEIFEKCQDLKKKETILKRKFFEGLREEHLQKLEGVPPKENESQTEAEPESKTELKKTIVKKNSSEKKQTKLFG